MGDSPVHSNAAKELLKQVLKMDDPIEIRNHMEMVLEEHGWPA